jgi:hypothetical protein
LKIENGKWKMGKKQKSLTQRRRGRGDSAEKKKTAKRNIARAQRLVRKHVKPGTSLVDELIAERRESARNE